MANELRVDGDVEDRKILPYTHHTRYHETDQQGVIHHSNYVKWMEDARMELLEQIGLGYRQMEELEIMAPILSLSIEYRSMVKFDETVVIETRIKSFDGRNMEIAYRMYDKATGEDRAMAKSTHCFVNKSGIPISMKKVYPQLNTTAFEYEEQ